MNRPLVGALFMAVLLVVYLAFTLNYAWILINDSSALVVAMGYALAVLPVVGAWALASRTALCRCLQSTHEGPGSRRGNASRGVFDHSQWAS